MFTESFNHVSTSKVPSLRLVSHPVCYLVINSQLGGWPWLHKGMTTSSFQLRVTRQQTAHIWRLFPRIWHVFVMHSVTFLLRYAVCFYAATCGTCTLWSLWFSPLLPTFPEESKTAAKPGFHKVAPPAGVSWPKPPPNRKGITPLCVVVWGNLSCAEFCHPARPARISCLRVFVSCLRWCLSDPISATVCLKWLLLDAGVKFKWALGFIRTWAIHLYKNTFVCKWKP